MLWRLPAPVRALLVSNSQFLPLHRPVRPNRTRCHSTASGKRADPLRILFCGSDAFSIRSLLALNKARQHSPTLIDAIHVAHRPAKPTGRGLKVLREVPIASTASSLCLPTSVFDTFTGYTPPFPYNLVVAVSFGLLVPPRILNAAKYGGLNVHPSLLPDLRGSAPIEHAILKRREYTGVSVQTLHPTKFDEGLVLKQTDAPGIRVADGETAVQLGERLGELGAQMLVDVLKEGRFIEPREAAGWYAGRTDYAPKITKQDAFVDFDTMELGRILAVNRALGDVWCRLPNGERLVVHEVADAGRRSGDGPTGLSAGLGGTLLFRAKCGGEGVITSSTYPGGRKGHGNGKVIKMLKAQAKI
ncbi:Methionyl-tRNA formyltransferase [Didymella heteroderae]|uniref:methionyl-tRNA formyltransferase n=1 Tax=Didymella heteroderae TaxID=1769908 RepID=A0A9P5BX67_9PLEO|nr:Methionyl-tRNA formyltransferase [Didymella heteroderae]